MVGLPLTVEGPERCEDLNGHIHFIGIMERASRSHSVRESGGWGVERHLEVSAERNEVLDLVTVLTSSEASL